MGSGKHVTIPNPNSVRVTARSLGPVAYLTSTLHGSAVVGDINIESNKSLNHFSRVPKQSFTVQLVG